MLKESISLHKIPYFDLATNTLQSVDKDKREFHDVMCVCPATGPDCLSGDRPEQEGYKFQFNYSIQPTMEPISYRLKGFKWNASLSYNDIGTVIKDEVVQEVSKYMQFISSTYFEIATIKQLVDNFYEHTQNERDNQSLQNKIFWKMKLFEWKGEEYDPYSDLTKVCMGVNIQSTPYIVTAKFSVIDQHDQPA